jgi:hypothetical protein
LPIPWSWAEISDRHITTFIFMTKTPKTEIEIVYAISMTAFLNGK